MQQKVVRIRICLLVCLWFVRSVSLSGGWVCCLQESPEKKIPHSPTPRTAMPKLDAIRQSPHSIFSNAKKARKAYDQVWNNAARAPVFCKITKKTMPNGKARKFYRTSRLVGSHAYMIAASGAGAVASKAMESDCRVVREEADAESARAPWMPQVSKGAKMVLEQFLCAVAQEATLKAHAVRQGCGTTKRINGKHMKLGWETVFDNVFSSSSIMPRSMYVAPIEKKKAPKKGKGGKQTEAEAEDEEYAPPEDAQE